MSFRSDRPPAPVVPPPPAEVSLLTIRVALDDVEPEVWRRFTIAGDLRLDRVHDVLQQVMGWTDSHLHQFSLGPPYVSPKFLTQFDVEEGDEGLLENDVRLDQVLRQPGDELTYEYDFGDGWTHTLVLELADPLPVDARGHDDTRPGPTAYAPVCLDGQGACPPEDVGGPPGYEEVAAWVRGEGATHELANGLTSQEMRQWLPAGWHPDHFDLEETNAALARLGPRDTATAIEQLPSELTDVMNRLRGAVRVDLDEWLSAPGWSTPSHFTRTEAEALTRPFRVVLEAVGDGLKLTPAGYLPGRVVEQILHEAGLADGWRGKGTREDLTPPVLALRERTRRFGLLRRSKGQLLPTALAGRLREAPDRLLDHVLTRTAADGREWERIAGGFMLVAVVAGEPFELRRPSSVAVSDDAYDSVTRLLSVAGFRATDGGLDRWDVVRGARLYVDALETFLSCVHFPTPEDRVALQRRVALEVLRRMR